MGFFNNIASKVKKLYSKADTAVGGYLPGGTTPSQASRASGKSLGKPVLKASETKGMSDEQKRSYTIVDDKASAMSVVPEGNISELTSSSTTPQPTYSSSPGATAINSTEGGTGLAGQGPAGDVGQVIETEKGPGTVVDVNQDGSYSFTTEDGSTYYTDKQGKTTPLYSGSVMPVTADDIMTVVMLASGISAVVKGVVQKVVGVASAKAATSLATKEVAQAAGGKFVTKKIVNVGTGASAAAVEAAVKGAGKGTIVNVATRAGVNSKTGGLLLGMISKSGGWMGKSAAAIGTAMGIASSYIFSGFIEEEASQQLTYAYNTAIQEGDLEGAQAILNLDGDIYDDGFLTAIPGINGIEALMDYYKAAKKARETRQKQLDRIKQGILTPAEVEKKAQNDLLYGKLDPDTGEYILSPTEQAKRDEAAEYYESLKQGKEEYTPKYTYNSTTGKYETSSSLGFGLLRTPGGYEDKKTAKPNKDTITVEAYNALTPDELKLLSAEEIEYIESRLGL